MANRRLNGDGSFYYNEDRKKWRLFYSYIGSDGERKRKSFYGDTKELLSEQLEEFKKGLEKDEECGKKSSLKKYSEEWLSTEKRKLKPKSYERKAEIFENQILPYFGNKKIAQITRRDIQKLLNQLDDEGYSYSTIKKVKEGICSCMRSFAIDYNVTLNPLSGIVLPDRKMVPVDEIKYFTDEQIEIFFNEAEKRFSNGTPVYGYVDLFYILLYTGMRLGEALALNWSDVDFNRKRIYVNKNIVDIKSKDDGSLKTIVQKSTKTAHSKRIVPLTQNAEKAFLRIKEHSRTPFVIANSKNKYVTHQQIDRTFRRIMKNSGLTDSGCTCTPHSFRHTFATILFKNGCEAKTISTILGHSSIKITCDTYVHVIEETVIDAMGSIDAYF